MKEKIGNNNLIYPYFVTVGKNKKEPVKNFTGIFRFSKDALLKDIEKLVILGLDKVLLFGVPASKNRDGAEAYVDGNIVAEAVRLVKTEFPRLIIFTDVCLCAYTTHGHCGILKSQAPGRKSQVKIDNKKTLEALARMAISHAEAGADWVAPSAMAKNQVAAIRAALDKNGFKNTKIMGYSAKFASSFYDPFRQAANSTPKFGDRRGYQLDYADSKQAIREISDDVREGADMVMVKPALSYLDVIAKAAGKFNRPLAAYNVSGEYEMVKVGASKGFWDEKKIVLEILSSIRRAGADFIITYHAKDVAKWAH